MNLYRTLIGLGLVVALAGCERSDMDNGNADNDNDMDPGPDTPQFVEFATFVKTEIESTPATAEATAVNDVMFEFNNRDNPDAFDDLFED